MKNLFARFVREEDGQDIIEYALLAAFISVVAYMLLGQIGTDVNSIYTEVGSATSSAVAGLPS
jgi:Flp pilus assembly pilin Flp